MTWTKKTTGKDLLEESKVMKPKREEVYSLKNRIVYLKCLLQSLKSPKEDKLPYKL